MSFFNAAVFCFSVWSGKHSSQSRLQKAGCRKENERSPVLFGSADHADKKISPDTSWRGVSAGNRTWTGTDVTPRDFKSLASAYFAIPAADNRILTYFFPIVKQKPYCQHSFHSLTQFISSNMFLSWSSAKAWQEHIQNQFFLLLRTLILLLP